MSTLVLTGTARRAVPRGTRPRRWLAWSLAALLAAFLAVHVPAFVCLPLDADVSLWDLFARTVLAGGVPYRDVFENNLPGMLWLHVAIRPVVGWRPEALRAVDLGVVTALVLLLVRWLPARCGAAARLGTALVLAAFYLSTSEWCHCQRDTWMLLPALLALDLRRRQVVALGRPGSDPLSLAARPFLEGLLWAAAFWIKPFVAVPALACWLAAARRVARTTPGRGTWLVRDGSLLLAGGLAAGAAGSAWLVASGGWADFWEIMWVWNRHYVAYNTAGDDRWLPVAGFILRFSPWLLVHLAALPLALLDLWQGDSPPPAAPGGEESARGLLLSALYVGWLVQAVAMQHLFDYVHVAPLLLALTVVCRRCASLAAGPRRTLLVSLLLLGVAVRLPALTAQRLTTWRRCLSEGSSAELSDRLSLLPRGNCADLDRVRAFLQARQVRDGELTCYNMRTLPLYLDLGVRPSTRYLFLENVLEIFRGQRDRVRADLAAGGQRYFVCDVTVTRWQEQPPGRDPALPVAEGDVVRFPHEKLIYRAGRYAVFAVDGADLPAWMDAHIRP